MASVEMFDYIPSHCGQWRQKAGWSCDGSLGFDLSGPQSPYLQMKEFHQRPLSHWSSQCP